jgi:hypothetical protein
MALLLLEPRRLWQVASVYLETISFHPGHNKGNPMAEVKKRAKSSQGKAKKKDLFPKRTFAIASPFSIGRVSM